MSLDFLVIGQRYGLTESQIYQLWDRLTDDVQFMLAPEPERWLFRMLQREGEAVAARRREKAEPEVPTLEVGKLTLVEVELEGKGPLRPVGVGKRTLVEEVYGRGSRRAQRMGTGMQAHDASPRGASSADELPFQAEVEAIFRATFGPPRSELAAAASDNATLPDEIRGNLESATGQSLSHVTVHAGERGDAVAASHGARAVAFDQEIYVARGQLDATSDEGRELLAHEVAHTLQATAVAESAAATRNNDAVMHRAEAEADDFAARFRVEGGAARFTPKVAVAGVAMLAPELGAARRPPSKPDPDPLGTYLQTYSADLQPIIREQCSQTEWPAVALDVPFTPRGRRMFGAIVAGEFAPRLFDGGPGVEQLLHPSNLREEFQRIVGNVTERVNPGWSREFGATFAVLVQNAVRRSLVERVGPHYRDVLVTRGRAPTASEFPAGQPIDRIVGRALTEPGVVDTSHKTGRATESGGEATKAVPVDTSLHGNASAQEGQEGQDGQERQTDAEEAQSPVSGAKASARVPDPAVPLAHEAEKVRVEFKKGNVTGAVGLATESGRSGIPLGADHVKAFKNTASVKANGFVVKLETALLNGTLDSELLDGVKIEFEANVLKMGTEGRSVATDPLTIGVKLTGDVEHWFLDVGRDLKVKLEGGLQVALGKEFVGKYLSKVVQAELEQRMLVTEVETVTKTMGTHATAVKQVEAQLATAQSRGLARREVQALERQLLEHTSHIRAGAKQLERLSGHIAEAQVRAARVLGSVKNVVAKKIGKAMEVRAIKFVAGKLIKVIPVLNVVSTIVDVVDLVMLIRAVVKGKYGSGGGEGENENAGEASAARTEHAAGSSNADSKSETSDPDDALQIIREAPPGVIGRWFEVRGEELVMNEVGEAWKAEHLGVKIGNLELVDMRIQARRVRAGEWDLHIAFVGRDSARELQNAKHDFWVSRRGNPTPGSMVGDLGFEPINMIDWNGRD